MAGRIEVDTGQLAAGRAEHAAVVGMLAECAGLMGAASQGFVEGAGQPGAVRAGEAYGARWGADLAGAGDCVDRAGANLAAAAEAYRETDEGQMRR